MLFEQVARQVVADGGSNGLTRVALIGALGSVHDFTAGGILGATDVAAGTPNGCFALLQARSGHEVRACLPGGKGHAVVRQGQPAVGRVVAPDASPARSARSGRLFRPSRAKNGVRDRSAGNGVTFSSPPKRLNMPS